MDRPEVMLGIGLLRGELDSGFRRNDGDVDVPDICGASAAGTAALCSSRAPLGRGKGAQEKAAKRWPAGCRPLRREYTDVLPAKPGATLRSHAGTDARVTADARVPFSLVTFFWASKRK